MKKIIILMVAFIILFWGSSCLASQSAVIGGIRDGAALGLMMESGLSNGTILRLGFEANTSNTPGIAFIGGKWLLRSIGSRFPLYLSGGLVGYLGNNAEAGPYISLIFDRFLDVTPLFLELGVDIVKSGRLQCQLGCYF